MIATPCAVTARELVDLLLRADVEAASGVIEDEDLRLGGEPFRQDNLLLIASRQIETQRVDAWRADVQPVNPFRASLRSFRLIKP